MRVAVVGAGVVGLSVGVRLLELDHAVTVFEQGEVMGERSVGSSRIFRLAHREPVLVELAAEARSLWTGWEQRAGVELIETTGTVVSGGNVSEWADAMSAAGASHHLATGDELRLPTTHLPSMGLLDPAGGVLLAERIGTTLSGWLGAAVRRAQVLSVSPDATVTTASGTEPFDAVVLCAGTGTPSLAAPLGLAVPDVLEHHARFSFRLRPGVAALALQAWLATSETSSFGSYQHLTADGLWAVGGGVDPADAAWSLGRDESIARQRQAVTRYATTSLDLVDPDPVETLYCTPNLGLDDGFRILRAGPVLAVFGDNLFKMAPVLSHRTVAALLDEDAPTVFGAAYS